MAKNLIEPMIEEFILKISDYLLKEEKGFKNLNQIDNLRYLVDNEKVRKCDQSVLFKETSINMNETNENCLRSHELNVIILLFKFNLITN